MPLEREKENFFLLSHPEDPSKERPVFAVGDGVDQEHRPVDTLGSHRGPCLS